MAVLYLDPNADGTPFEWFGTFSNVDDGVRQPTSPTTVDSLYIDNFSEGDECNLLYPAPSTAGTITQVDCWTSIPNGEPELELKINGSSQGYRSSKSGITSNSWAYYRYTALSIQLNGAVFVTRHVTGSDEDDEIRAAYLEVTYTPAPASSGVASMRHILENSFIAPPFLGKK
mgnify:CR=1 FL=1